MDYSVIDKGVFAILWILSLTLLYSIFKTTIPKIFETWVVKERELKSSIFKEKYLEEIALYKELWPLISSINSALNSKEAREHIFESATGLRQFLIRNRPFIHPSIQLQLASSIDFLSDFNFTDMVQAEKELGRMIEELSECICLRVYKYDR